MRQGRRSRGVTVGEARGLQLESGRDSEETWGVNMAELKAKPNTCGDMALPWVMVTD